MEAGLEVDSPRMGAVTGRRWYLTGDTSAELVRGFTYYDIVLHVAERVMGATRLTNEYVSLVSHARHVCLPHCFSYSLSLCECRVLSDMQRSE